MTAKQFFQAGQLNEAVQALNAEVRNNPADVQRRTFLFELLCFTGDYGRAEKQLNLLADGGEKAQMGAVLYHSALHGQRVREETFDKKEFPSKAQDREFSGAINGQRFSSISDADPRIGKHLEMIAAGAYLWIALEHIESIELEAPRRLRDLLWAPALVRTGPSFKQTELGEILIPVIYPFSHKHADDQVRLGRATVWEQDAEAGQLPYGQKMLLVDDEEFPFLEIRKIEFDTAADEDEQEAQEGAAG